MTSVVKSWRMVKSLIYATVPIFLVLVLASPAVAGEDLASLLFGMEAAYTLVQSYTARFVRQEVVDGSLRPREEAQREILFVPGRNDNRMLVREPGLFASLATIVMTPDSPRVLRESRHPVTDIGIGQLIELILDNARRASAAGELTVRDDGTAPGADGLERRLEVILPREREKGYYCHRFAASLSTDSGLPVRAIIYDWDDRMVADYAYRELRLNPPLTRADFDAANPEYGFPYWHVAR